MGDTAFLSNDRNFTIFQYGNSVIRFAAPYSLIKYLKVKQWDDGYLVVDADYSTIGKTEEYIDLRDILIELYIDADRFLRPIRKVELKYDEYKRDS